MGSTSIRKHQELLQQHWGSSEVATLPGADIQRCLLGVSPSPGCHQATDNFPFQIRNALLYVDNFLNPCCISFQANRLLELALHLECSVISLKMDALRLWNIALAGTACGNLLSTIENAYSYPETRQSKEEGLYFETVD